MVKNNDGNLRFKTQVISKQKKVAMVQFQMDPPSIKVPSRAVDKENIITPTLRKINEYPSGVFDSPTNINITASDLKKNTCGMTEELALKV